MKTYKHLYEKFLSDENLKLAIYNASLGSKNKKAKQRISKMLENLDLSVKKARKFIVEYVGKIHKQKEIYDGISRKKRKIVVPTVMEQIYCHAVVNVLKPIFMKGTYKYSYGSIPGRGSQGAKKVIEKWLRKDKKGTRFCLKVDVKKYFPSIPQKVLREKLCRIIKDEWFLDRVFEILKVQDDGIPLGFYTSQWFASWYLQGFDHFVKEKLGVKYFVRWMDDIVILCDTKWFLHKYLEEIEKYLSSELGLKLNNKTQIFPIVRETQIGSKVVKFGRDIDFMGYRFFRTRTILRRTLYYKGCRKAKKLSKKERITVYDCKQMITYYGWFGITDTYDAYVEHIKPYVDFRYMRMKVGKYDRRMNNVAEVRKFCKAA